MKYGDISPRTAAHIVARLLERGKHMMVAERFGQAKTLPQKSTRTMKFRRYKNLDKATAPLAEGVTPPGSKITYEDVTVTLQQYGDWIPLTDVITDTHEDPILQESSDILGEQYAETIEYLRFQELAAGTSVYYGGSATQRSGVKAFFTRGQLQKIRRELKKAKAQFIASILKASVKISTEPVNQAYFGFIHTDCVADLQQVSGFVPIEKYSDSDGGLPGEIGKVDQVRFIESPLIPVFTDSGNGILSDGKISTTGVKNDVYPVIIVAKNAYGLVALKGKNAFHPMVLNPDVPRGSDPLGQRGSVGWKTWNATVILNDSWMTRVEVAATENPNPA